MRVAVSSRALSRPASLGCLAAFLLVGHASLGVPDEVDFLMPPRTYAGTRVLGLAGAFAGLADDAGAVRVNPAGMMSIPRSFDVLLVPAGNGRGARPRSLAGALHPTRWIAVGFQWEQTGEGELATNDAVFDTSSDQAFRALTLSGGAIGAAFVPNTRWGFGATLDMQRLSFSGSGFGEAQHEWSTSFVGGIYFRPLNPEAPRLGLTYRHKADWRLGDRSTNLSPPGPYLVRTPAVVSAGVSWHYEVLKISQATLSLHPDWVLYSQLTAGPPTPQRTRDDLDLRCGLEISLPSQCWTGCGSMTQVRIGIANLSPRPFAAARSTRGSEAGQGLSRETHLSIGAALALRAIGHGRFKAEAAYDWATRTLAFGLGWRYPESFRAEIENHHRR